MNRIYHTWDKWECYLAGFYDTRPKGGESKVECEEIYRSFLSNTEYFGRVLDKVISEWKNSCEHYLTNGSMNRIAWLGQASLSYEFGIPASYRGGFNLLTEDEKKEANSTALKYLNKWMITNGHEELDEETVKSKTKANIY